MNLDSAIQKHMDWKVKFRTAISKQEQMDSVTISKDNCCDLGKWLHEEGKTQCSTLPSYATVLNKHAAFHVEAGKVASAINAKKYTEAETMLDGGSAFTTVSGEVGIALMRLKKEAA
ncbi:MAG: CZB domain-containing protein [Methylobacter tundripaludum]|uniref:Chemoreceptor zinc-binding protein n=1 Tax=Methylobacter tundripaludum TaxID=173365 RepID=A0A2S6GK09_9GAMM|nr:CZB domain-containing protein [Methylobacter tundripaludum]MCK9637347.1 CZB domain-containing protein [Methylobacter tundripaludum]PPK65491.1 chemoreceptor zinc-binding protein [Methylobacter tundripaludum]